MINLQTKHFSLTYAQCILSTEDLLAGLKDRVKCVDRVISEYVICQEEHKDGNPHLHAYIVLDAAVRKQVGASFLDVHGHHPNIQETRSSRKWVEYIVKGGKYITNIQKKVDKYCSVPEKTKKELAQELISGGKSTHALTMEYPKLLFGYSRLCSDLELFESHGKKIDSLGSPCGLWLWGPSGSGKSTIATTKFGEYYAKGATKWWDGFRGQSVVICEDVDAGWKEVLLLFKIWADKFPFTSERKGGSASIRPRKLIVTSNYTIEELLGKLGWSGDKELLTALERRFDQVHISKPEDGEQFNGFGMP